MSQDNLEIVRRVYDAFNRGDLDELIESFSLDAEQVVPVLGQTHHGRAEIRKSFEPTR
jgi:ketosteroid isomerase-like protein